MNFIQTLLITSALISFAFIAGCCSDLNRDVGLIGVGPLPALTDQTATNSIDETPHPIDRASWPRTTVQVAVRQTETHPTYFNNYRLDRDMSFPTATRAVTINNDESTARKEAALNVVAFPYDFVRTPIQMIGGRLPRDVDRSPHPDEWYDTLPDAQPMQFDRWRVRDENAIAE